MVLFVVAALLGGGGFYWFESQFVRGASRVSGQVMTVTPVPRGQDLDISYVVNGTPGAYRQHVGHSATFAVGQEVQLLVNPDTPPYAALASGRRHDGTKMVVLGILALGIIVAFGLSKVARGRRQHAAAGSAQG